MTDPNPTNVPPPLPPPGRPALVWVIACYYVGTTIIGGVSSLLVRAGIIHPPLSEQAYLHSLTWVHYASTTFLVAMKLAGSATLLLLRRAALYIFTIGFLASLADLTRRITIGGYLEFMGFSSLIGVATRLAFSAAVVVYVAYLARKRVLR